MLCANRFGGPGTYFAASLAAARRRTRRRPRRARSREARTGPPSSMRQHCSTSFATTLRIDGAEVADRLRPAPGVFAGAPVGAVVRSSTTSGVVRSPGVRGVLEGDLSPAGKDGMAIDTAPTGSGTRSAHPLDALSAQEIEAAANVLRADGRLTDAVLFAYFGLDEPSKEAVARFTAGDRVDRQVRVVLVPGPATDVVEAIVDVGRRAVVSWLDVPGARPALLYGESFNAIVALHDHPEWKAALARRGITDLTRVQIDPWPAGNFGLPHEEERRISRCLAYYREIDTDNGYARPIEGLIAFVDNGRGEVLEVVDHGVVPLPSERGGYLRDDVGPMRDDLRPIEITQPEGPSFTVDGNLVRWQRWSLRIAMDPYEGLLLHTIGYEDGGRVRPILHRASVSEMVVPYGHTGPMHNWKNAFDAGEWGLGRMANSLTLGCDCLGEVRYLDVTFGNERGEPYTIENAICMHEEDYSILWKHVDLRSGTTEVRRQRRLVISSIATVGNYEYGFYWYFYLDGSMQLEVKLTGVMSTMAVA